MPGAVVHVHGEHDTVPTWAQFFNIPKVPKSVIDHLTDLHRQFGVGEFVPPIVKLPDGFSIIFFHQEAYEGPIQGATLDHGEVDLDADVLVYESQVLFTFLPVILIAQNTKAVDCIF